MSTSAFKTYLKKVEVDYRRGIATEHTYRPALKSLLETLLPDTNAFNDPRHIECGAPDFVVEHRKIPLGYVETKDVGVDLDKIEKTDQLKRYFKALNNLILTDYLEFRWYVRGELRLKARIADISRTNGRPTLRANPEGITLTVQMFTQFSQTETPTVTSAKELATRMAEQTHLIRDLIINALKAEDDTSHAALVRQYKTFCDYLLPDLKREEFGDLYAQTMAYGLFAAKLSAPANAPFNRSAAYQYLTANKFLRRLFLDVGEELDSTVIAPFLDDIAALLAHADLAKIQTDLFKRTRSEDPVVHFYETFLSVYDPKLRESRGVYYTPEPVVQFIVHSVDWLIKNRFGKTWGLADPNVKILDPAAGTATFLYYVIQSIHEEVIRRGQSGTWPEKSKELLRRVFGFELLMAPYVVSHLKLGLLMQSLDAPLSPNERLQVYLTNTLEEGTMRAETIEGLGYYIAEEASQAARVKKQEDIMVVLGNPPYSATSANIGEWITNLVRDSYYPHDEMSEHNPKLLLDDYVKFIRFGEWRIGKTGHGILAFITNHGYLDNPTFRGMRQHLMQTFDEIYVLDLHGNSKKKERTPEGGKDENVFDIQQGVAILLAIKNPVGTDLHAGLGADTLILPHSRVHHASLWGLREEKYTYLQANDVSRVEWMRLQLTSPFSLFVPQDIDAIEDYKQGWKITEIFPTSSTGIKTHRDHFVLDFEKQSLEKRIQDFRDLSIDDELLRKRYDLPDTRDWKLHERRKSFNKVLGWQRLFTQCLYRPFDIRNLYYHPDVIELARPRVIPSMLYKENIALVATRQVTGLEYCHVLCANLPVEMKTCSHDRGTDVFPLYIYTTPEETAGTLFAQTESTRKANLNPTFLKELAGKLGLKFIEDGKGDLKMTFGPEDIFNYAYAVFHSPTYRQRYAEFLKLDFPRLPLTSDRKLFAKLVTKGQELVGLHLLTSPNVDDFITSYPVAGKNTVEKVQYANGKVWINTTQYFGGVPENVWEFKIGGYQVCNKWLKDRKDRSLSNEEINHYQRIVVALKETIGLMKEIDKIIPRWPME